MIGIVGKVLTSISKILWRTIKHNCICFVRIEWAWHSYCLSHWWLSVYHSGLTVFLFCLFFLVYRANWCFMLPGIGKSVLIIIGTHIYTVTQRFYLAEQKQTLNVLWFWKTNCKEFHGVQLHSTENNVALDVILNKQLIHILYLSFPFILNNPLWFNRECYIIAKNNF